MDATSLFHIEYVLGVPCDPNTTFSHPNCWNLAPGALLRKRVDQSNTLGRGQAGTPQNLEPK